MAFHPFFYSLIRQKSLALELGFYIVLEPRRAFFRIGESSNGRTTDFDSVCLGSNPSSPKCSLQYTTLYNAG